jgi:putative MATE family efflux protein
LLVQFSLPAIVGMLTQALYNLIDRIFVGRALGEAAIAGTTICFPFMLILIAFGMLIGFGAAAIISIRLGENKREEAENVLGNAAVLLVLASIIVSTAGLWELDRLLVALGASKTVLPYAHDYMAIILAGNIFQMVGFGLNSGIRAEGNPRVAMITLLVGVLLNILLAPFFIFPNGWHIPHVPVVSAIAMPGFDGGMRGAALATVCAQMVSAVWVLCYFLGGRSLLRLHWATLRLKWRLCREILIVGSPPFTLQLAACVMQGIMNHQLKYFGGDTAVSIIGIIQSFAMMILMPIFGLNQGLQPIIGYNYGAEKFDRVKRALMMGIVFALIGAFLGFAVVMIFPAAIIRLFDPNNQGMAELGTHAMRISMLMLPIVGVQIIGAGYFQAVGKPKMSMFLSLSRQLLLLIPAILILPIFFQLDGVWASLPTADACSLLLTGSCLLLELRHLQRRHESSFAPASAD